MSKEEMKGILEEIAQAQENIRQLEEKTDGLILNYSDGCRIHIDERRWNDVINAIQPVVMYNPNWDNRFNYIKAYFYMDLCGKKYMVFSLLKKEVS